MHAITNHNHTVVYVYDDITNCCKSTIYSYSNLNASGHLVPIDIFYLIRFDRQALEHGAPHSYRSHIDFNVEN